MKKQLPTILIIAVFASYVVGTLIPKKNKTSFDLQGFASLPVVFNGRVQPIDSVAMNSLLMIQGKRTVKLDDGKKLQPIQWLVEVAAKPELADTRKIFMIHHPDLLSELNLPGRGINYFSYNQLDGQRQKIMTDYGVASNKQKNKEELNTYDKAVLKLATAMYNYESLENSFRFGQSDDFTVELEEYVAMAPAGFQAMWNQQHNKPYDQAVFDKFLAKVRPYSAMSQMNCPLIIPPTDPEQNRNGWSNLGASLIDTARTDQLNPAVMAYAKMMTAYRHDKDATFNSAVANYKTWLLDNHFDKEVTKGARELYFNNYAPFMTSIVLYIFAFILAGFSLFLPWPWLRTSAFAMIVLTLLLHTSGLIFRMVLEGRPPVTNLYSSAIFIGWGTIILGLVIEKFWKNGIGSLVASFIGFVTLIIAHNLSLDGDTMELLQAVLDTNIWLATHVVVITLGYSSMFLAGLLGALYLILGVFTNKLDEKVSGAAGTLGKAITKIVYGVICFATLFSFVGTVLGGIWADQSWGRFWGWDPKENGALLIVLWCAVILHARWGGMIREKGLMVLAVFGNIVTSFSWFGVNMLGVGLHSYGFMEKAFYYLMAFIASQVLIMGLAAVPAGFWRSRTAGSVSNKPNTDGGRGLPIKNPRPRTA